MHKKFLFVASFVFTYLCFLLTPGQLFADQTLESELAKCVDISGDLERLDCFESVLRKRGLMPSVTEQKAATNKWVSTVQVNPLDDSKTVVLVLAADSASGRFGGNVTLVLHCKSNKTEAYINWGDYLGRHNAKVLVRVGSAPDVTKTWDLSTDNESTFVVDPIQFIKELLTANSFVAQTTPYNESPITAVFDTTGLDQEIKELRATCGW